jgi:hypothetical protein
MAVIELTCPHDDCHLNKMTVIVVNCANTSVDAGRNIDYYTRILILEVVMKKITALIFTVVLAVGSAFADHPSGWGIGIQGGWTGGWKGSSGYGGGALSLKIPSIPVFWGISGGIASDVFRISVTGDYYIIDKILIPEAKLGWYLGIGGYVGFYNYSSTWYNTKYNAASLGFGARLPIGVSWQPIDFLELYLDVAPSLGVAIDFEGTYKDGGGNKHTWREGGVYFPDGGWGLDIGIRFWI